MLIVNDEEFEDRNDSNMLTNTVRIAWHGSIYIQT